MTPKSSALTPHPQTGHRRASNSQHSSWEQPSGAQDWSQILFGSCLPLGTVLCLSFFIHKMELKGGKM